jgi:hypothetical protein
MDRIISMTRVNEYFAKDDNAEQSQIEISASMDDFRGTPAVTISEIQDHIWIHSHEEHPRGDADRTVRSLDADLSEGHINIRESRGRRKVTQIVKSYSAVEQESQELQRKLLGKQTQLRKGTKLRPVLEGCYSALRLRKFLDRNNLDVPDFIEDCDFQKLQEERRAEKEKERLKKIAESGNLMESRSAGRLSSAAPQ